jgi:hypothetical protein
VSLLPTPQPAGEWSQAIAAFGENPPCNGPHSEFGEANGAWINLVLEKGGDF